MFLPGKLRLFGASCAGCGEVIAPSEVVRRAQDNIYHTGCFVCVLCSSPLNTGDEFYLRDDARLICKADFHKARDPSRQENHGDGASHDSQSQYLPGLPSPPSSSNLTANLTANLTFTRRETEVLQEVYRACPNPSHDTLQRISSQHGLDTTRVRVWFHAHRRKENGATRNCGASYGAGDNSCSGGGASHGMERAVAPSGGYPLPIVNEVSCASSGRVPPTSSRSAVLGDVPRFPGVTSPPSPLLATWPLAEDVWRPDFVPPNVDLNPCDIKNGEVCSSRRGFPPAPAPGPTAPGMERRHFGFDEGADCLPHPPPPTLPPSSSSSGGLQGQGDMPLPWINC